jgi:hypothetical protein
MDQKGNSAVSLHYKLLARFNLVKVNPNISGDELISWKVFRKVLFVE